MRFAEGYSEDPYLCSRMAENIVGGAQGEAVSAPDKVVAGLCHYPGQSQPVSGLERGAMEISERALRETFLPPWVAGIKKAGALGLMPTYPAIDDVAVGGPVRLQWNGNSSTRVSDGSTPPLILRTLGAVILRGNKDPAVHVAENIKAEAGPAAVSLAFMLHNLVGAACVPFIGRLVDWFGARKVILVGTATFGLVLRSSEFLLRGLDMGDGLLNRRPSRCVKLFTAELRRVYPDRPPLSGSATNRELIASVNRAASMGIGPPAAVGPILGTTCQFCVQPTYRIPLPAGV